MSTEETTKTEIHEGWTPFLALLDEFLQLHPAAPNLDTTTLWDTTLIACYFINLFFKCGGAKPEVLADLYIEYLYTRLTLTAVSPTAIQYVPIYDSMLLLKTVHCLEVYKLLACFDLMIELAVKADRSLRLAELHFDRLMTTPLGDAFYRRYPTRFLAFMEPLLYHVNETYLSGYSTLGNLLEEYVLQGLCWECALANKWVDLELVRMALSHGLDMENIDDPKLVRGSDPGRLETKDLPTWKIHQRHANDIWSDRLPISWFTHLFVSAIACLSYGLYGVSLDHQMRCVKQIPGYLIKLLRIVFVEFNTSLRIFPCKANLLKYFDVLEVRQFPVFKTLAAPLLTAIYTDIPNERKTAAVAAIILLHHRHTFRRQLSEQLCENVLGHMI